MGSHAMFIQLVARRAVVALLFAVLAASKASAQFDFAASWAPIGSEDVQNDSLPVDYLGLALSDEARARALSYDESQKSMIERQCASWGAAYLVLGFVPGPMTPLKDVRKVMPGERLIIGGGTVRSERYWRYPAPDPDPCPSVDEWAERIRSPESCTTSALSPSTSTTARRVDTTHSGS